MLKRFFPLLFVAMAAAAQNPTIEVVQGAGFAGSQQTGGTIRMDVKSSARRDLVVSGGNMFWEGHGVILVLRVREFKRNGNVAYFSGLGRAVVKTGRGSRTVDGEMNVIAMDFQDPQGGVSVQDIVYVRFSAPSLTIKAGGCLSRGDVRVFEEPL